MRHPRRAFCMLLIHRVVRKGAKDLTSEVMDVASLVARGYTTTGRVPGGRYGHMFYWPWATIIACVSAFGLLAGSAAWLYRLFEVFLLATLQFAS